MAMAPGREEHYLMPFPHCAQMPEQADPQSHPHRSVSARMLLAAKPELHLCSLSITAGNLTHITV